MVFLSVFNVVIGRLSRDAIGCLSVRPRCYWLSVNKVIHSDVLLVTFTHQSDIKMCLMKHKVEMWTSPSNIKTG